VRLGEAASRALEISHPSNTFMLDGKSYPGRLVLRAHEGGLTAINELDLETYLKGVLPEEMSSSWPLEALKAQAVVSRTYAVYNFGQFHNDGFDLAADPRSQVYRGLQHSDPRIDRAVDETRGQVLTYHGEILNAYFHSCCGGHTRAAFRAWHSGQPVRPLMGVVDTHCSLSPNFNWQAYFPSGDVLEAVQKSGVLATRLISIEPGDKEVSGYLANFKVRTEQGESKVPAEEFRRALDPSELKSSYIVKIRKQDKGYLFIGHGFGHGVGMCQWGARAQAEKGRKFRKILEFYYPESTLRVLEEPGG
jgi:stage II sporulation protein D